MHIHIHACTYIHTHHRIFDLLCRQDAEAFGLMVNPVPNVGQVAQGPLMMLTFKAKVAFDHDDERGVGVQRVLPNALNVPLHQRKLLLRFCSHVSAPSSTQS